MAYAGETLRAACARAGMTLCRHSPNGAAADAIRDAALGFSCRKPKRWLRPALIMAAARALAWNGRDGIRLATRG
jgi:hypothetical protein